MPVRIYQLAKEFKLDSKDMVDRCAKAGVTGKGSALASLTDEEEVKVRAFLAGASSRAVGSSSGRSGGVATLAPPAKSGPLTPSDYIPPAGVTGKPPALPSKSDGAKLAEIGPAAETPKRSGGDGAKAPGRPVIRVAALPTAQQPPTPAKPEEPAPQKPDIKLPTDVIRAGSKGKPLGAHIKQLERAKAQAEAGAKKTGGGRDQAQKPPLPLPLTEGERRERERRRGKEGAPADSQMGTREERQKNRKRTTGDRPKINASGVVEDDRPVRRSRPKPRSKSSVSTAAPRKGHVVIQLPCNVRSFSASIGVPVPKVLQKLLQLGTMSTITSELESETIELLSTEFGAEVEVRQAFDIESQLISAIQQEQDAPDQLEPRPPVVTFLGHVDHGKTSLLDRIIGTNVAAGESGGITQHIRAYRIEREGRAIAFVDTPGHEAFTQMRARGANVTDIAVLVVAADDGVMPQTEEAISHARAAGVPIVVALNKIDLPGTNIDRIMQQLAANELLPAEWGGNTEVVKCSALTGLGVEDLLETLLTIAELHEYKANPHRRAYGTCLESEVQEERGVVAKFLVQNGTLKVGDVLVCGSAYGRVKAMYDTLQPHVRHETATPSTPVNLTGLHEAPAAGEHFYVLEEISHARDIAEKRTSQTRRIALSGQAAHVTLENLHERLGGGEPQLLNIILRADVQGSIEAILKEFSKLEHPEVQLKVLQKMVGGITEADVHLADASDAVIIGFNVVPDEGARLLADQLGVQIRRYDIIYQVTDDIKKALEGMLKPEERDVDLGRALVQRTFLISRLGTIAGCRVLAGTIERNSRIRVIRENRVIGEYPLESLKREKDDAREVREGMECGMKLRGFNDLKEGDVLECYRVEEIARTL
ncbi:MAG TPA: translation initiation factor IF-2 [Pirellulales bacterium]|nr:translation initiation factor IF-2 [Pirellulales bacterium]